MTAAPLHRVVLVGAGFGGLYAAKALKGAPVGLTVIDRRNFHLFQPLLYQVATGSLSPGEIASPIRHVLRDRKSTRLNSSHLGISYAVFCLKKTEDVMGAQRDRAPVAAL